MLGKIFMGVFIILYIGATLFIGAVIAVVSISDLD